MLNEVFKDADGLSLPVAEGVRSGTPLRIGILNGVAITDEGSVVDNQNLINGVARKTGGIGNEPGYTSVKLSGAFNLTVTGALATVGLPVYIKADGTLTAAAAGAFLFGAALRTKGSGTGKVLVRLIQSGQTAANA